MVKRRIYPVKSSYRVKMLGKRLSDETEKILSNDENWKKFLRVASKFISYPFHTQILLYSQKPDTLAVATYQLWKKLGLKVGNGTHGIPVLDKLDTAYPSITQLHPIENVEELNNGRKKPAIWKFPKEAKEKLVDKICGLDTLEMSPEERIWQWTITNAEESDASEVFNQCRRGGYTLGLDEQILKHSEFTAEEWLTKFIQASVAYEVFSRCELDTKRCDELNQTLLNGNPFSLSDLFQSNEEAIGFLGDIISLTAGSAFHIIKDKIKEYETEQMQSPTPQVKKKSEIDQEVKEEERLENPTIEETITKKSEKPGLKKPAIQKETEGTLDLSLSKKIMFPGNFHIADDHLGEGGAKEKFQNNLRAIEVLHIIEREKRPATYDEQKILSKYVGWGGLADAFDSAKENWKTEYEALKTELSPEEYRSARGSVLNSHYTSPVLIRSIYAALSGMGFEEGNILEPACGIGNFFGMLPEGMQDSNLFGVELDAVSGRIAQLLYPDANISISGYETMEYPDNFFDVVIGNVPFGDYKVMDRTYDKYNFRIHDYFIAKGLDQLRPGGVMVVITSSGTMDKINETARRYFSGRAELLGAIRLPDNAFKANAGTEVMTDILFFQKADHSIDPNPEWLYTKKTIPDEAPLALGDIVRWEMIRGYNSETGVYDSSIKTVTGVLTEIERAYNGDVIYKAVDIETKQPLRNHQKPALVQRSKPTYVCNAYFQNHPEMVLGELKTESGPFGERLTCKAVYDGTPLEEKLTQAIRNIKGEITGIRAEATAKEKESDVQMIPADPSVKNFSYTIMEGDVYYRENSVMILQDLPLEQKERLKALIDLRNSGYSLLNIELEDGPEQFINEQMVALNDKYEAFVKKYGRIVTKENHLFQNDVAYGFVSSFEKYDEKGKWIGKADLFSKRTVTPHITVSEADTAEDALLLSLSERGKINLQYMAGLLKGIGASELPKQLEGVIYRDPEQATDNPLSGYVTSDEYLSGNIREKLIAAEKAAETDPNYAHNVDALKAAMPTPLEAQNIDVRLGATWIAPEYIEQFMEEKLNVPHWRMTEISQSANTRVEFEPVTAEWHINNKSLAKSLPLCVTSYGTERKNALEILENTLNLRDTKVYDHTLDAEGRDKTVLNKQETALCNAKAEALKTEFENWVFNDPKRRTDLVKQYNEKFNNLKTRSYDGSFLKFPGMNPDIQLKEYQKNAVARALFGGNELLAHVVGAGKTYTMVACAMEARRIGAAHKSLFVVPDHLTEQWGADFLKLYPAANILVATKKDFTPARRQLFCSKIATGDYDAAIIGHSQFEKIPLSKQRQVYYIQRQIDKITDALVNVKVNAGTKFTVKQLEKTQKKLKLRLEKLNDGSKKDDTIDFEQLGVDRLFVDESHYYKNLFLYTKMNNVAGVQQTEAAKSSDMYMKCQYMNELTNGRGIVFATGTPISNSMTELYTNMRYLQSDLLNKYGLDQFDAWAANFGNVVTAIELTPEGVGYRAKKRFSSFFNIPELMSLWHEAADVQTADMLNLPVPEAHIYNVKVQPTTLQKDMVAALADRADDVRNQRIIPDIDNMLKITNDGRKLALDQRLINPNMPDVANSKVNACIDVAFKIWNTTKSERATQLIFCDLSTPRSDGSFNVYDDIKQKLVKKGVSEQEIAFIHDAKTEVQKDQLFRKVRNGDVRLLLGSTQKMGAGTNVQDHLIAVHHLDVPWRPSDIEQREGRIIRQGNLNTSVSIYRYVTTDTFDAYSWQLIENKQKFISQIMTSKSPIRSCADIDESTLSYAEVKALATGNPYIKEKMELDVSVAKLKMERAAYQSDLYHLQDDSTIRFPKRIVALEEAIVGMKADIELYREVKPKSSDTFLIKLGNHNYTDRTEAGAKLNQLVRSSCTLFDQEEVIGEYLGFQLRAIMLREFDRNIYRVKIKGRVSHEFELSLNSSANISAISRVLNAMPERLAKFENELSDVRVALMAATEAARKPFGKEKLYQSQMARLKELDTLLNISENADPEISVIASETVGSEIIDQMEDSRNDTWTTLADYESSGNHEYEREVLNPPEITEAIRLRKENGDETKGTLSSGSDTQQLAEGAGENSFSESSEKESDMKGEAKINSKKETHHYDIQFSTMGDGITVWDKASPIRADAEKHKVIDYKTIAYISLDGKRVTYFIDEDTLPDFVKKNIANKVLLQKKAYDPDQEDALISVHDFNQDKVATIPFRYRISVERLLRNDDFGIDTGDCRSFGTVEYKDGLSALLAISSNFREEKARIQIIEMDEEGNRTQTAYRITEQQLEEIAQQEVVKQYGVQGILKEPLVRIEWSESELFKDGEILSLREANILFAGYDQAQHQMRAMIPDHSEISVGWYKKTKFQVITEKNGTLDWYEGRYDLGDGDGDLLNHIYSVQKNYIENENLYAVIENHNSEAELKEWKRKKSEFLYHTLPQWRNYLRYEIVEKGLNTWQIYDRFHHCSEEGAFGAGISNGTGKPKYFSSAQEAKEFLDTKVYKPKFNQEKRHVSENREIITAQKKYAQAVIESVKKCYSPLSDTDKELLRKMAVVLGVEPSKANVKTGCIYVKDGKIALEGVSLYEAVKQLTIDHCTSRGRTFQINTTGEDGKEVTLVKANTEISEMPVTSINEKLDLRDEELREALCGVVRAMPAMRVKDPYNCLRLTFEEYSRHEGENPWKYADRRYLSAIPGLSAAQKEKITRLNYDVGFYASSEDIKAIAAGKVPKGSNPEISKATVELASELKEEVVDSYDSYLLKKDQQFTQLSVMEKDNEFDL